MTLEFVDIPSLLNPKTHLLCAPFLSPENSHTWPDFLKTNFLPSPDSHPIIYCLAPPYTTILGKPIPTTSFQPYQFLTMGPCGSSVHTLCFFMDHETLPALYWYPQSMEPFTQYSPTQPYGSQFIELSQNLHPQTPQQIEASRQGITT
jgi:hypothetical protein